MRCRVPRYVNDSDPPLWTLPAALMIHGAGYLACLREPRVFDLWIAKVSRCPRVRNWQRWGCNSYAV